MASRIKTQFGKVDVLVNNAGVFDMSPVLETTEESFDRVFSVNVKGLFFTLQAAAAIMVKNQRLGKIINLASEAGRRGEAMIAPYCASKAAVISITQSVALELIRKGIHVNAISPGIVDTPMWDTVDALFAKKRDPRIGFHPECQQMMFDETMVLKKIGMLRSYQTSDGLAAPREKGVYAFNR